MGYTNAPIHRDLYQFLTDQFGPFNNIKRYLILWPRGHGKTECATFNYVSWLLGNHPDLHINIVSKTSTLAEEILTALITRIESDDAYTRLFPHLKPSHPKKWTSKEIIVNRPTISKNPSIKATGLMGPITGGRSHLVICDDIIDEENVRTRLQLEKVDTWFNKVLFPTMYPDAAILVIGTRWHYADLYNRLLHSWPHSIKKAIINDRTHEVLWPSYWSYEKLQDRQREIGTVFFNCQYQNDPTGMEGDLLQSQWLHPWDTPPPTLIPRYAGVDPALGEGDQQAIARMSYAHTHDHGYLEDVWADTIPFPLFLQKLRQEHAIHQFTKIFIEANAFQKVLMYVPELQGLPIVATQTVRDKESRFISMSSHFESQRVTINPLLMTHSDFWNQWVQFPRGQYDDALDATEIVTRQLLGKPKRVFI
jgi:predicted phage terminase large subunit-like protein